MSQGTKRWVQLCSVGNNGPVLRGLVSEDCADNPSDPNELSQTNFDEILKQTAEAHGVRVFIGEPSNVHGPEMRNQLIQILSAMRKNLFAFIGREGASAS